MVMGHLSEMFSAAGREKVNGESNVILGNRHRPSGEMGARLKKKRISALLYD